MSHQLNPYSRAAAQRDALREIAAQRNTVAQLPNGRLVLTRRPGESIQIGGAAPLELMIVSIIGNTVKLAFQSQKTEVPIFRSELVDRVMAEEAIA